MMLSNKDISEYKDGWITNEGKFIPCEPFGHIESAFKLRESGIVPIFEKNPESYLMNKGWIKISSRNFYCLLNIPFSQSQLNTIADYLNCDYNKNVKFNGINYKTFNFLHM